MESTDVGAAAAPATPTQPRGGRLTAEERRAQILETAIELFGRHGFKGATTKALAAAAGVSEATIFKHFPTKADLYSSAFERRTFVGTAQLVTELQGYADRRDDEGVLQRMIRAILTGYEQDRDLHRMLLYAWLEQGSTENNRMWSQMRRSPLFDFLDRYVRQRQAEGVFRADAAGVLTAALVAVPVHHAISAKLYGVDSEYPDEQTAETYARLLLDGLRGGTSVRS